MGVPEQVKPEGIDSVTVVDIDFTPTGDQPDFGDGIINPSAVFTPEEILNPEPVEPSPKGDAGDLVDSAIQSDTGETVDRPLIDPEKRSSRRKNADEPKAGPPNLDEWQDFFSRIILRFGMEWYTDYVFRGVDEDLVSDRDVQRLRVTREERDLIAKPFAEYANKNPFVRKHGRQVVALTGSIESLVALGVWVSRVNRIAKKYKPAKQHTHKPRNRESQNGNNAPGESNGTISGTTGGTIPNGFPNGLQIFNPGSS